MLCSGSIISMRRLHWPKFKAPRNCRKQSFMNVCSSGNGTAGVRTFACGSQYLLLRGGYYLQAAADIENDWVGSCSNLKTSPFRVWRFCGAREKVQRRFKGSRTFPEPLILISFFFLSRDENPWPYNGGPRCFNFTTTNEKFCIWTGPLILLEVEAR